MLAFIFIIIIGNEAGFICINCSGAVPGEEFKACLGNNADDVGSFRLFVSWVIQGIVVTGEDIILGDSGGIWLY
jgi:hypothetical protein